MAQHPSISAILLEAILTVPGLFVLAGIFCALAVFIIPLCLTETQGWRETENMIIWADWGLSIAALLVALGLLIIKINLANDYGYVTGYRYGLTAILFSFASRRLYHRIKAQP